MSFRADSKKRQAARRRRRVRITAEQDGRCMYCTGMVLENDWGRDPPPPAAATLEHVQQKTAGGTYADDNTGVACQGCNVSRPNGMSSTDYKALRTSLLDVWPPCSQPTQAVRRTLQMHAPQGLYRDVLQRLEASQS